MSRLVDLVLLSHDNEGRNGLHLVLAAVFRKRRKKGAYAAAAFSSAAFTNLSNVTYRKVHMESKPPHEIIAHAPLSSMVRSMSIVVSTFLTAAISIPSFYAYAGCTYY